MNSYQLKKQTARSRRNDAQKVQRPSLNLKASKDKAKERRKSSSSGHKKIFIVAMMLVTTMLLVIMLMMT
jgi:hypothetical protein